MKTTKLASLSILFLLCAKINYAQEKEKTVNKQEKGFFNLTSIGYYSGIDDRTTQLSSNHFSLSTDLVNVLSLRTVNGIFLTPHLSLGLGIGADGISVETGAFYNTFQVYSDVRYYFRNQNHSWFLYGNLGRAVKIDSGFEEGLSGGFGFGNKFMIAKRTAMMASFGYNEQEIKESSNVIQHRVPTFAIRAGFLF